MSGNTTTKPVADFDKPPRLSKAEKAHLEGLTDDAIARAAGDDADNPVLTQAELAEFEPVADAKRIRRSLNLTQEAFARAFTSPSARYATGNNTAPSPTKPPATS